LTDWQLSSQDFRGFFSPISSVYTAEFVHTTPLFEFMFSLL